MSSASDYDPNINEQQNATESDPSKCLQADDLGKHLNIAKFNKMMNNTASKVTDFVDSYIKEQQAIKDKRANLGASLDQNRYKQTAMNVRRKMVEKHENHMKMLNREHGLLTSQIQNTEHTKELYKILTKQNAILKKEVEKQIHIIEISDRKAYYENEQNGTAGWWSDHFIHKFKYLIILLILAIIISKRYKEIKLWAIVALLALYPIIAFTIVDFIIGIFKWIRSNSRLVYLHTDM
jgi:hypothetical protein